ncbi:MAG: hypothetical protein VST72_01890 [Nitrospirota bacterium]|nr:hypothetical protein [Nitrospirota bacterium]
MTDRIQPSLHFTIICDDIRQETGGKISLMGLFENIYATKFPVIHPRLAIISEWIEGKGEFDVKTQILSTDRKTVVRQSLTKIKLNEVNFRHRNVSIHLNINFDSPGTYWIENFLDDELINSIPLRVIHINDQPTH